MTDQKNKKEGAATQGQSEEKATGGGFWVAAIMLGLLVLIVAVEMLRSKG